MEKHASSQPSRSRRAYGHLQSASGAFDLPSILIGVAVVAILAIGVLAAVFRVVPWTQDNAAKQDLAAVYTAQGTAYARDAQEYKDLNGLEDAGLISDMDPAKATITVSEDGKGYQAVVTSNTGKKWFITHDSPTPREWEETAAAPFWLNTAAWASDTCTPNIVNFITSYSSYSHPGVLEMMRQEAGLPYDQGVFDDYLAITDLPLQEPTESEEKVLQDLLVNSEPSFFDLYYGFFDVVDSVPSPPTEAGIARVAAAQSQFAANVDALMLSVCHA